MKKAKPVIVISLGGSLISPASGIDYNYLKKFRGLILSSVKKGTSFVIVCGGGATARNYQEAAQRAAGLTRSDLDWIGIHVTHLNGHLMRVLFGKLAHPNVIKDPTRALKTNKPIIIAAGWKPGASTDYDAVLLAKKFKAGVVINLSNIDMLYDKDPKKYKKARPICQIDWRDFRKIVGNKWSPGLHLPFDPVASRLAEKLKLQVILANGKKLQNLKAILNGKSFTGTVIG